MKRFLRTASLLVVLAGCKTPGDGACADPGSACEVVTADGCAEWLACHASATEDGGTPYITGGLLIAQTGQERASVTAHLTRVPAVGETVVWTPQSGGDFEVILVERYGDAPSYPLQVTHAAGMARDASATGPARPAQGTVRVHVDAIAESGALSGWLEAECPPVAASGDPVTVHLAFGPGA